MNVHSYIYFINVILPRDNLNVINLHSQFNEKTFF